MSLKSLQRELKRRKVPRVGGVYIAVGLGVIYAADAILPALLMPEWTVTFVIVLVGLGLPLALGLAWAFDVTPDGVVRTAPVDGSGVAGPDSEASDSARGRAADSGQPTLRTAQHGDRHSIVVLPFADLSPNADHEYFSDGLTEEIIADLAGVRALAVISRTSAMRFKGTDKGLPAIGRMLDVQYVLEGSVRKAGERLRITAQLIDARTDEHLWAEKYDGFIQDVFDVQERVSREIVRALNLTLTSAEDDRLSDRQIADVRAFELYLKARRQLQRYSDEGVSELLAQAVAIEGETPPLRALKAWAQVNQVRTGMNRDMRPLEEAEVAARGLLKLAPQSNYGHVLLGYIEYERGHHPEAVKHFRTGLTLESDDADARFYMGVAYNMGGQSDLAQETSRELLASDPLAPLSHVLAGAIAMFKGDWDVAVRHFQGALELDPDNLIVRWCLGYTLALAGNVPDATPHADWLRRNGPGVPYTVQLCSLLDALEGREQEARDTLATVNTAPLDAHNRFHLAESFAMAGEVDRALDLLEYAVGEGFYPYHFIVEHCPFMAPLRDSHRFESIAVTARELAEAF